MADLFVSYARADRAKVAPLVAALEAEGWSVWWDPEISPGEEFDRLISEELNKARAVIVVWTPTSVASRWVRGEAREGADRGVLAPVRFENATLPIDLRAIHTTDLDGWNEDRSSRAFSQLARALRRLTSDGASAEDRAAPTVDWVAAKVRRRRWRWPVAALGAAFAAVFAFSIWRLGASSPSLSSIAVQRISAPVGDGNAQEFADRLAGDVATMAAARPTSLKIVQPTAGDPARFVVTGEARTVGEKVAATLNLSSTRDRSIIWSANVSRPVGEAANLSDQAATRLADVLTCAFGDKAIERYDSDVLKLFVTGCAIINDPDTTPDKIQDQFRQVVARAPDFARAWAQLAMVDCLFGPADQTASDEVARYQRAVEADAAHALRLDPRQALAWSARATAVLALADWPLRRAYLDKALALQPDEAAALEDLNGALTDIGRVQDALTAQNRAAAGDPLSPDAVASLAFAEALAGRLSEAQATLAAAERRWPGDPNVSLSRITVNARLGDAAAALKELDDPTHPTPLEPAQVQYFRLLSQARLDPARSAEAAAYMRTLDDKDQSLSLVIQGLVGVGHVDDAFDLLESHLDAVRKRKDFTGVFFRPYMAKFLASPRFMPLAARVGLIDIWRKTGLWPDYCTAPGAPYDCKAAAAKAMAAIARRA